MDAAQLPQPNESFEVWRDRLNTQLTTLAASDLDNDSGVTGETVADALDTLDAGGGGGGAVDSVFTRTGAVVAAASDYDASQIDNDSGVAGSKVSDALDTLEAAIPTVPVDSVHGRTGAVVSADNDYGSDQITNDSGVTGTFVTDALDQLDGDVEAVESDVALRALASSYMSRQNNASQDLNGTNVVCNWNQLVTSAGSDITWLLANPSRFTIAATGVYLVMVNVAGNTASTQRANITLQLRVDGTDMRGPEGSSGYLRSLSNANTSSITLAFLYPLSSGTYVEWVANQEGAAGSWDSINAKCTFSLWRIA